MRRNLPFLVLVLEICACSSCEPAVPGCEFGLGGCEPVPIDTWDEVPPGEEVYLDRGEIGVDPRTENAFVLRVVPDRELYALEPEADSYTRVMSMRRYSNARMLFPEDSVLVLGERSSDDEGEEGFDEDTLILLDPYTLEEIERVDVEAHYRGVRVSPSRRWIALYNTRVDPANLQVLDIRTLRVVSFYDDGVVSRWMNTTDELLTVRGIAPRIDIWPMVEEPSTVIWPEARASMEIEGHVWSGELESWDMGISPDDETLVVPLADAYSDEWSLVVIDVSSWTVRYLYDAMGPVDFTADGATFYAYRQIYDEEVLALRAHLLVVDVASLEVDQYALPFEEASTFFVSETGIYVGIVGISGSTSGWFTPTRLAIFDLNRRIMSEIEDDVGWTSEKVLHPRHDELYMVQVDGLSRLDMYDATIEPVGLYVHPLHVALLPSRLRIVLDDASSARYSFWDLDPFGDAGWVVLP